MKSTVLITGCSSGIGLVTAEAFARRGDRVFAGVRATSDTTTLQTLIDHGLPIETVEADLIDEASLRQAVATVVSRTGSLDIVVSNAGIGGGSDPVEEILDETARGVFEANVLGNLRLLRAVLPRLRSQRHGTIVAITSLSARLPRPFIGLTSASKHALEALYEALAFEVAPFGLRVKLIEPGMFRSRIMSAESDGPSDDTRSAYSAWTGPLAERRAQAMARALPPDAVAEAVIAATEDPSARPRYLVGAHAESALAERESMAWNEWYAKVLDDNHLHQVEANG